MWQKPWTCRRRFLRSIRYATPDQSVRQVKLTVKGEGPRGCEATFTPALEREGGFTLEETHTTKAPARDESGPSFVAFYALPASFSRRAASCASLASDPPELGSSEREAPSEAGAAASAASAAANFSICAVCILWRRSASA